MNSDVSNTKGRSSGTHDATPTRGRSWWRRLIILGLFSIAFLFVVRMGSSRPENLGVSNGKLAECPDKPNCVSTQTQDESKKMEPIPFEGDSEEMIEKIKLGIERQFSRAELIRETDNYLHYEFTSLLFRFVDDVEFLVDDESKQVHFRSASRVGYSDLGANRNRMQIIVDEVQK